MCGIMIFVCQEYFNIAKSFSTKLNTRRLSLPCPNRSWVVKTLSSFTFTTTLQEQEIDHVPVHSGSGLFFPLSVFVLYNFFPFLSSADPILCFFHFVFLEASPFLALPFCLQFLRLFVLSVCIFPPRVPGASGGKTTRHNSNLSRTSNNYLPHPNYIPEVRH